MLEKLSVQARNKGWDLEFIGNHTGKPNYHIIFYNEGKVMTQEQDNEFEMVCIKAQEFINNH